MLKCENTKWSEHAFPTEINNLIPTSHLLHRAVVPFSPNPQLGNNEQNKEWSSNYQFPLYFSNANVSRG